VEITTTARVVTVRGTAFSSPKLQTVKSEVLELKGMPEIISAAEFVSFARSGGLRPETFAMRPW